MAKYKLKPTVKYRKDYKSLKKRGYDMSLLKEVIDKDVLTLLLSETGTHSDLF